MTWTRIARPCISLFCFVSVAACSESAVPVDANDCIDCHGELDAYQPDSGLGGLDSGLGVVDAGTDAATTTDAGTDAATTTDTGCPAPVNDLTALGTTCSGAGSCPSGYTCRGFSGIVLTQSCEIDCDPAGCPCPATTTCNAHADKASTWHQCDLP